MIYQIIFINWSYKHFLNRIKLIFFDNASQADSRWLQIVKNKLIRFKKFYKVITMINWCNHLLNQLLFFIESSSIRSIKHCKTFYRLTDKIELWLIYVYWFIFFDCIIYKNLLSWCMIIKSTINRLQFYNHDDQSSIIWSIYNRWLNIQIWFDHIWICFLI